MTTPVNRITRFQDRTEVFQYSNKDDDWLLASPQVTPNNRKESRQNGNRQENQIPLFRPPQAGEMVPVQEILFEDPEIANLMREYNNIKEYGTAQKKKNHEAENEKEREKAERTRQEGMRQANQAEQLRACEQARRQDQFRLEAEIQRNRELQERERQQKAEKERMEAQLREMPAQIPQPAQNAPRQGERVTLNINDWLKMTVGQPPIIIEHQNINVEKPRNSLRGNRVTMDFKAISSMFTENYNKYENISNKRQTLSRKSLSYRTSTNPNFVAFDRYFQALEAEPTEAELAEEKFFADMEEQSERRLQESQIKMAKLQEEIRELESELSSIPDESAQKHLDLSKWESCLDPIKKFYYNLRIQILQIETSQLDPYCIYCEFILDEDMFFKLRREDSSKPAEILTMYNSVLDVIPSDALIDLSSKIEMLRLYFSAKLDRLPSYQLLHQMGAYYGQLKELEDDLARLSSIFSIRSMEMSRTYEKLTFELAIHHNTTVLVTLKLMELMETNYYEFYHIETSRDIIIPEEKLMGDDLIDIIEAMSECL